MEEKRSKSKRYYWIKLKKDFFNDIRMMKADKMENGKTIIIIYIKILLESLENDGKICHMGIEPNIASELALVTGEEEKEVKRTLEFLEKVGCIRTNEDKSISMLMLDDMVGSETASAKSMRKSRAKKKKNTQCDNKVEQCCIEKDNKKNIEELYREGESTNAPLTEPKKRYGVFENVYLTDNELNELYELMNNEVSVNDNINYLSSYMRSHGKEDEYKDHFAILVQWYTEDKNNRNCN